ncbi:MAG: hypothetical protein V1734_01855 [Nanoarchaeota archaeon]
MTGKMDSDNKGKKNLDTEVEQVFKVQCRGRDREQKEVFVDKPFTAEVRAHQRPGTHLICLDVTCLYQCGAHGGECSASKKKNDLGHCPYSIDLPWAIDNQYGGEQ